MSYFHEPKWEHCYTRRQWSGEPDIEFARYQMPELLDKSHTKLSQV